MINQSVLRHIFKESGRGTNLLQFAEIQLLDNEACIVPYNEMTRQELFHSENMICAGTEKVIHHIPNLQLSDRLRRCY